MIVAVKPRFIVLGITSNSYKDKTYYQAQVFCPDSSEAGSIGISENLASELKPNPSKVVTFNAEYNDKFEKLILKSVDSSGEK